MTRRGRDQSLVACPPTSDKTLTGLITALPPTSTGTISAPTLIIWGDRDDLLSGEEERQLAAAIPGSRLVVYQDTGHLVLWSSRIEWLMT